MPVSLRGREWARGARVCTGSGRAGSSSSLSCGLLVPVKRVRRAGRRQNRQRSVSGSASRSSGLAGADAGGLDDGVLAVATSVYCGWWLPGTPAMPLSGMFVQVME